MHENDKSLILLVDDTDSIRYASARILSAAGFNVIEAETGNKALIMAKQNPDLIILDIELPDISGYEVCRRLKSDPAAKSIPVLHLTAAYPQLSDKIAGLEGGADGYLTHPVDPLELTATVNALLRLKRAEAEALETANEWQRTFDSVNDVIWILDTDHRIRRSNKAAEKFFRYSAKDLIGRHCWEIVHGTGKPIPQCPFLKMKKSMQRETMDLQIDKHWFEISTDPLMDKDNRYSGVIHVLSDITKRKQVENILRRRTEELETVLDAMPTFVWIGTNRDCTVVKGNQAANRMTGVLSGNNVSQTTAQRSKKAIYIKQLKKDGTEYRPEELPMQRAVASGKPVKDVFIDFRLSDGRQVNTLGNAAPLFDEHNQPRGAVAAFLDITEYRNMEAQLRQAQKMEAVGRLAGGVAHDFNNMLSIINGYSELALMQLNPSDPLYHNIQSIKEAGLRSADLTSRLLAFARRQPIAPDVLNLNRLIDDCKKMLEPLIGEDIALKVILEKELYAVKIDPSQVNQILFNLAVNSRDAVSETGAITIKTENVTLDDDFCRKHPGSVPGKFALLSFADSGCGMDEETRSKIFEPFFTTKDEDKGTGLGLATVYGIVKQNSGFIDVKTSPGRGTVVLIYFPRIDMEEKPKIKGRNVGPSTGSETILVVEDEVEILNLCRIVLKKKGYTVYIASTPEEAIRLCKEHARKIHLLLTDVVMPRMNGKELYDHVKKYNPRIQVLYMSGYTSDVIIPRGAPSEGTNFIRKPFSLDDLAGKVRDVLDT